MLRDLTFAGREECPRGMVGEVFVGVRTRSSVRLPEIARALKEPMALLVEQGTLRTRRRTREFADGARGHVSRNA